MEVPVKFNIGANYIYDEVLDGNRKTHFLQCYRYDGQGYTVSFELSPALYELANKQSEQVKRKTNRVFKTAVECAIDNWESSGVFSIYLDEGSAFDVER